MDSTSIPNSPGQWRALIRQHFVLSAELKLRAADATTESILNSVNMIVDCYRSEGKVLICGNGGSAADAQHMAAEFMNRLSAERARPGLPAIALTTDTSFLTSYANDIGFGGVFERQVLALGRPGDVLIAVSTSGQSGNILRAVEAARVKGLKSIGLMGEGGGLQELVDEAVVVPSRDTQLIQETLLTIEHVICEATEEILFA
jgi:D-sedoheptulose 7-phosphate isomerase